MTDACRPLLLAAVLFAVAPTVRASDSDQGAVLYRQHCASCHGATGRGEMPGVPNFARGDALLRTDAELLERIRRGRLAMPGYFGILTDEEILDVVSFLRTLQ